MSEEELSLELINNQIRAAINDRMRLDTLHKDAIKAAATAEATYKVAAARERHAAKSADGKRVSDKAAEDIATLATESLFHAYLEAVAERDIYRQAIYSNTEKRNDLRTLASSYRELELKGN